MAKIAASNYVKPAPVEKENPFIELVKPYTDKGLDTPFDVEFDADDYKAEKLQIQAAVNKHGFSAREYVTDYVEDSGQKSVKSTFLIRPMRKRKGVNVPDDADTDTPDDAPEDV